MKTSTSKIICPKCDGVKEREIKHDGFCLCFYCDYCDETFELQEMD